MILDSASERNAPEIADEIPPEVLCKLQLAVASASTASTASGATTPMCSPLASPGSPTSSGLPTPGREPVGIMTPRIVPPPSRGVVLLGTPSSVAGAPMTTRMNAPMSVSSYAPETSALSVCSTPAHKAVCKLRVRSIWFVRFEMIHNGGSGGEFPCWSAESKMMHRRCVVVCEMRSCSALHGSIGLKRCVAVAQRWEAVSKLNVYAPCWLGRSKLMYLLCIRW